MPANHFIKEGENDKLVLIGEIVAAHGIKGNVKIRTFTDSPENIKKYKEIFLGAEHEKVEISFQSSTQDIALCRIKGVEDRNAAEALKGKKLYIKKSALSKPKKNEYYLHDLVGCEARHINGSKLGEVISVNNFGAGDIIEIALSQSKKTEMYAINANNIPEVNIQKKYIIVNPPEVV